MRLSRAPAPTVIIDSPVLRRATRLEVVTLAWNFAEGAVALWAARAAGSAVLLGFGLGSLVESLSAGILLWRLGAQRTVPPRDIEALDRRARRLVAVSLFALAAVVAFESVETLAVGERPRPSVVGLALAVAAIVVMSMLSRAKHRAARAMGSRALESDAFQSAACGWLSLTTLVGVGMNRLLGWWWADPAAALVIAALLAREGRESWRGDACVG